MKAGIGKNDFKRTGGRWIPIEYRPQVLSNSRQHHVLNITMSAYLVIDKILQAP
jgi:hypothetical protein